MLYPDRSPSLANFPPRLLVALALALASTAPTAHAGDPLALDYLLQLDLPALMQLDAVPGASISFHGYGTFGLAMLDRHDAELFRVNSAPSGDLDNVAGLQARVAVTERLSGTLQLVSRASTDYRTKADWAFATYDISDWMLLRIGHLRAPIFLHSDFTDVGITYPWLRPPMEVYRAFPNHRLDGLELFVRAGEDDALSAQLYGGSLSAPDVRRNGFQQVIGFRLQASHDPVTFSLGHATGEARYTPPDIDPMLGSLFPVFDPATQAALSPTGKRTTLTTFGVKYDSGRWRAAGEHFILRHQRSLFPPMQGGYVMASYVAGRYVPHLTYGRLRTEPRTDLTVAGGSGNIDPDCDYACSVAQVARLLHQSQHSWTLGLRINVAPAVAVKLEWQRIHPDEGSPGQLTPTGGRSAGTTQVYSAGLNLFF